MAEEFTIDQTFLDAATVDMHKRPVLAVAPGMELSSGNALAGTGLAQQQYGGLGAGHLPQLVPNLVHRGTVADQ